MKIKNKFLKYCALIGATIGVAAPTVAVLSSCSSGSKQFTIATSNDVFANSVTQLGASFTDSPSTTEFQSAYGALVTYVNEGDYVYDSEQDKYTSKPNARLVLEAATKIVVYGKKTTTDGDKKNEQELTTQISKATNSVDENAVLFTADSSNFNTEGFKKEADGSYSINNEAFGKAMVNAKKVEFTLNKDLSWVDKNGEPQQPLVPKDFLDSLKGYKQSSDYGLNANGYFLDLAGIDYNATINLAENASIEAGKTFTYVIGDTTKTPYFLDILNKQYFFPVPHSHPDTPGTLETPETSNALKFIENSKKQKIIDKNSSDWSRVYGGAQEKGVDVWSIGPYYISHSSQQDVTFSVNQNYFKAMEPMYDMNRLDIKQKIPTVIKKYKAGDPATIYNKFNSGELSFAPVPQAQSSEAATKYQNSKSLISVPASKPSQGRYIGYNLGIFNEDGTLKNSSIVGTQFQKFIKNFHSANSLKIRKGLNELINWAALAEIKYTQGTRDFSLSSIPYATYLVNESNNNNLIDYYEAIMSSKPLKIDENSSNIQKSANSSTNSLVPKGLVGDKASKMKESNQKILTDDTTLKSEFESALKSEGYTKNDPLKLDYWTLSQSKDPKDTAYFTEVASQINTLSNGAIQFTYHDFNTNSVNYIYYDKAVVMGDMLWGPDYNGLGTWVGLYFEYEFGSDNKPLQIQTSSKPSPTSSNGDSTSNDNWDNLKPAYHITNLWKPLYEEMKKAKSGNSSTEATSEEKLDETTSGTSTTNSSSWLVSLYDYLVNKKAITKDSTATTPSSDSVEAKSTTGSEGTYKDIAPNLSTEISIWAGLTQSNGVNLVNWIDSQYPILPMYQVGLDYQGYKLVDPKYTVILNLNGDVNYRDFVLNTPIIEEA